MSQIKYHRTRCFWFLAPHETQKLFPLLFWRVRGYRTGTVLQMEDVVVVVCKQWKNTAPIWSTDFKGPGTDLHTCFVSGFFCPFHIAKRDRTNRDIISQKRNVPELELRRLWALMSIAKTLPLLPKTWNPSFLKALIERSVNWARFPDLLG